MFTCSKYFITQFLFPTHGSCSSCTSGSSWAHSAVAQLAASAHSGTPRAGEFWRRTGAPTHSSHHAPSCPPTQQLLSPGHIPASLPPILTSSRMCLVWLANQSVMHVPGQLVPRAHSRGHGAVAAAAQGSPFASASAAAPERDVPLPAMP